MTKLYFSRAGRAGPDDIAQRMPELAPLRNATICVAGLGCLGAPSALEFARCGARELRVLDHDFVDPATICRWPVGIQASGLQKAEVLMRAISSDYPFTDTTGFNFFLGSIRDSEDSAPTAQSVMKQFTDGASLIYDATAESGIQHYLSDYAADAGIPYVGVDATAGGWGGRVVRIMPGVTDGCYFCYRSAQSEEKIPEPPMHPSGEVQPVGCADPTFTGASFDMVQVALMGVRVAVSTLCSAEPGGYPNVDWDVTIISLRSHSGEVILPKYEGFKLSRQTTCQRCNP